MCTLTDFLERYINVLVFTMQNHINNFAMCFKLFMVIGDFKWKLPQYQIFVKSHCIFKTGFHKNEIGLSEYTFPLIQLY